MSIKRSDMVKLMVDAFICYQENEGIKDLYPLMDKVLKTCEEEGMYLVDDEYGVTGYEPEEGWDAWLEEQYRKEEARDFQVIEEINRHTGKPITSRSKEAAKSFLQGKSFEELAKEENITRERVIQIVAKERCKYKIRK